MKRSFLNTMLKRIFGHSTLLILYFALTLHIPSSFAQDSPQWHLPEGATTRLGKGWLSEIQYSPDGTRLAAAGSLGVWIYDTATDEEIALFTGYGYSISVLVYSPDGSMLAVGCFDGSVRLLEPETGEVLRSLEARSRCISSLAFNQDGSMLASGAGRRITLWNPETGELLNTLEGHTERVNSLVFNSDGSTLISGSRDDTIRIWDVATGS